MEDQINKLGQAALEAPLGDAYRVAQLKGEAIGLKRAIDLNRQAFKDADLD